MKKFLMLALTAMLAIPCAANAQIDAILQNGGINDGATWTGGLAPVAGDTNQWATAALTIKAGTGAVTWEGQELIVQTGGRLTSGPAGASPTLTFAGDLTLDGGTIAVLNNNPFFLDLAGNTLNLNSGALDSGQLNNGRDLIIQNSVWAGSGTIDIIGGSTPLRSAVIFQNSNVSTSGFTGLFNVRTAANFFLPNIDPANASFGIDVNGSGQLGLTNNVSVTSAVFDGLTVAPGTYTRDELLAINFGDETNEIFINLNRVLAAGATGTLTVVSGGEVLGDFDGNGTVDLADLDQYIGNIGAAVTPELADLDLDGDLVVGANDFQTHYTTLVQTSNGQTGTFAGDANLDGVVDVLADAASVINNLGVAATSWSQGDFNGDGTVDVLGDAAALINNLGNSNVPAGSVSTSAVPEPGSLSLLALAGLGAIGRRRR